MKGADSTFDKFPRATNNRTHWAVMPENSHEGRDWLVLALRKAS